MVRQHAAAATSCVMDNQIAFHHQDAGATRKPRRFSRENSFKSFYILLLQCLHVLLNDANKNLKFYYLVFQLPRFLYKIKSHA